MRIINVITPNEEWQRFTIMIRVLDTGCTEISINVYYVVRLWSLLNYFTARLTGEPCDLIVVKMCLYMFQLAIITISMPWPRLYGSCDADKTCVFLRLVSEMSDTFLEQRINIKFCVKLGKNYKWHLCNALRGLWGTSSEKAECFWVA
jgi:hypothetical protein